MTKTLHKNLAGKLHILGEFVGSFSPSPVFGPSISSFFTSFTAGFCAAAGIFFGVSSSLSDSKPAKGSSSSKSARNSQAGHIQRAISHIPLSQSARKRGIKHIQHSASRMRIEHVSQCRGLWRRQTPGSSPTLVLLPKPAVLFAPTAPPSTIQTRSHAIMFTIGVNKMAEPALRVKQHTH